MRPTDENQYGATRPNLMSSGSRRGPSEENILAMLERDAARRRLGGSPRFAMYAASSVVVLGLLGALAWLMHENNSANDVLRMSEQPGVSVTVVPDKPAAQASTPAVASETGQHPATAATIIDNPEPSAQKAEESRPALTLAKAEDPRSAITPAQAHGPRMAPPPSKQESNSAAPVAKAQEPRPDAPAAKNDVPPLVLLTPAQATAARGSAPKREADAKKAPAKEPAPHGQATTRASSKTTSPATGKGGSGARDDAKRVTVRERAADAPHPSRAAGAGKQATRAKQAAVASSAPAKSAGERNATSAHSRKKAPAAAKEAPVDTDVALISAIIMHADGRAHRADDDCAAVEKRCAAKAGAQQP